MECDKCKKTDGVIVSMIDETLCLECFHLGLFDDSQEPVYCYDSSVRKLKQGVKK